MNLTKTEDQTFLELVETTELGTVLDDGPHWALVIHQSGFTKFERPTLRQLTERLDELYPRGIIDVTIEKGWLPV